MKFARDVASDLARIDFKERLVQSVLLFQEGLETGHIEVALLKFWTGVELLCVKEEPEPTKRVVERASSIFDDYRVSRHLLMENDPKAVAGALAELFAAEC